MTLTGLKNWVDNLSTKFHTERGQLRVGQRDIRKLIKLHENDLKSMKAYIDAVDTLNADKVTSSLLKKGYLVILEDEFVKSFAVLDDILRMYRKELNNDLKTVMEPVDQLPPAVQQHVKKLIKMRYDESLDDAEKSLNKIIGSLAGMASINLDASQLLEDESLLRNIYADFRVRGRKDVNEWKKIRSEVGKAYKQLGKGDTETALVAELFGSENGREKGKFVTVMGRLFKDYLDTVNDCVQYIQKLSKALDEFEHKDDGAIRPSLDTLEKPVSGGGKGFPNDRSEMINKKMKDIHDMFKSKVNEIIGLTRRKMAEAAHQAA